MKKIAAAVLSLLLLIGIMPITASADQFYYDSANHLTYAIHEDYVILVGLDEDYTGDVVIPAEYDGYPVRATSYGAFTRAKARSIRFPEGFRTISSLTFDQMNYLQDVYLPSTLEYMGMFPFYEIQQKYNIHIPDVNVYCECENESVMGSSYFDLYVNDTKIDGDKPYKTSHSIENTAYRTLLSRKACQLTINTIEDVCLRIVGYDNNGQPFHLVTV